MRTLISRIDRFLKTCFGNSALSISDSRLGAAPPYPILPSPRKANDELYSLAARGTNDGFWDWDLRSGQIQYSNRWKDMIGFLEPEIGGQAGEWFDRVHPDDLPRLRSLLDEHLAGTTHYFEAEYRIRHKDGSYLWMLARGLAVREESGTPTRLAGAQTDITQRKQSEEKLIHRAFHDELTGLPNRALLTERLRQALERLRSGVEDSAFAVLFIDLDRFKNINDSLGHLVGDELLKAVAAKLTEESKAGRMVARLGGDEFAILLTDVKSPIEALRISNALRKRFVGAFQLDGHEIFITPSIGIAWGRKTYEKPEDLLRDADIAMYQAKKRGRNCCEVFAKKMHSQAVDLLQLENDLHRALENDELLLHFQPIVELKTGLRVGFEALIRWDHPEQGLLFPKDFLSVAEESGLIAPLSWWALRQAARSARRWLDNYPGLPDFSVSVNLSGRQVLEPELVENVLDILRESNLAPKYIRLEITESVLMKHADATISRLAGLQQKGIQLHLDDFGTGYSSLSYLNRFPFNALKIDRSFISKLDAKGENWKIVRAMVDLAHNLGMSVIVEGLETVQQIQHMKDLRCEFGQGYYFSPPIDDQTIASQLAKESGSPPVANEIYWEQAKTG